MVWYNNLDVVPFLEALDKMSQFWCLYSINMLREAISLPRLEPGAVQRVVDYAANALYLWGESAHALGSVHHLDPL